MRRLQRPQMPPTPPDSGPGNTRNPLSPPSAASPAHTADAHQMGSGDHRASLGGLGANSSLGDVSSGGMNIRCASNGLSRTICVLFLLFLLLLHLPCRGDGSERSLILAFLSVSICQSPACMGAAMVMMKDLSASTVTHWKSSYRRVAESGKRTTQRPTRLSRPYWRRYGCALHQ